MLSIPVFVLIELFVPSSRHIVKRVVVTTCQLASVAFCNQYTYITRAKPPDERCHFGRCVVIWRSLSDEEHIGSSKKDALLLSMKYGDCEG